MILNQNFIKMIGRIAWAQLLLHFDFYLGTINIIPDWISYALIVSALATLADVDETAELLRPLGTLVGIVLFATWGLQIFSISISNSNIIMLLTSAISLYFHFQLFTNLAHIAEHYECKEKKGILTLRTINTIVITVALILKILLEEYEVLSGVYLAICVVSLIVGISVCVLLFQLKGTLRIRMQELAKRRPTVLDEVEAIRPLDE